MSQTEFLYASGFDIFSQNGEDGINEKLFELLDIKDGVVLDIGAWDGFHFSNCANLWSKDKNFKSILIESTDRLNKSELETKYENVECFNAFVDNVNTLEKIIDDCKFDVNNDNFVLCSIDVDGPDKEVVESLGKYKPKILIVEPNGNFSEKEDSIGMSISEWISWGVENLYEFIGMSGYLNKYSGNMYFVRKDLKKHFKITKKNWKNRGVLLPSGIAYE